MIPKPCITCGRPSSGSYCERHRIPLEVRQPYRRGYSMPEYRRARAVAFERSGGRCEHVEHGARCQRPAAEAHHVRPLSSARNEYELRALNTPDNLLAVCPDHNP